MKTVPLRMIFLILLFSLLPLQAIADNLPRFVSLSSDKVYLRAGPGKQYPVVWIYQQQGYPVEIIREFEHWRKIRDRDGYGGWVYKSLLSGQRTGLVQSESPSSDIWLKRSNESDAQKIARIEPEAILLLKECDMRWCNASAQGITGWIERKYLWGIYENEIIE